MAKLLPGYIGLGDTARRVLNTETGEILSRRQYAQKVKRGGLLTNEELAKLNKAHEPLESISRPTKGRSSLQKLAPEIKKELAQTRIESIKEKKEKEAQEKKKKLAERKLEQLKSREVVKVPKKITLGTLKPGSKGRRIPFNTYEDYLKIRREAEKSGHVLAIGLGAEGIDPREEIPRMISFTVFPMRPVHETIKEDEFNDDFSTETENRSYFVFLHFWAHLAFRRQSYEKRAKAGNRTKQNPRGTKRKSQKAQKA
jgi:hypothetical protein